MTARCMYFINLNRPAVVCRDLSTYSAVNSNLRADTLMVMQFYCSNAGASRRRRWKSPAGRIVCVLPVCVCEREREKLRAAAAASEER